MDFQALVDLVVVGSSPTEGVCSFAARKRSGAAEARWAHNPKVGGSKPPFATLFLLQIALPVLLDTGAVPRLVLAGGEVPSRFQTPAHPHRPPRLDNFPVTEPPRTPHAPSWCCGPPCTRRRGGSVTGNLSIGEAPRWFNSRPGNFFADPLCH
jgi:hypothetical protein